MTSRVPTLPDVLDLASGAGGGIGRMILSGLDHRETVKADGSTNYPAVSPSAPAVMRQFPGVPLYGVSLQEIAADTFQWPSRRYAGDPLSGAYTKVLQDGVYDIEVSLGALMYVTDGAYNGSGIRMQVTIFTSDGQDRFAEFELSKGGHLVTSTDPTFSEEIYIQRILGISSPGVFRRSIRLNAGSIIRVRAIGYAAPPSTGRTGIADIQFDNSVMVNANGTMPPGGVVPSTDPNYIGMTSMSRSYLMIRKI